MGSPLIDSDYATPGSGNVCSDGVHPSTQGCKFPSVQGVYIFAHVCLSIVNIACDNIGSHVDSLPYLSGFLLFVLNNLPACPVIDYWWAQHISEEVVKVIRAPQ